MCVTYSIYYQSIWVVCVVFMLTINHFDCILFILSFFGYIGIYVTVNMLNVFNVSNCIHSSCWYSKILKYSVQKAKIGWLYSVLNKHARAPLKRTCVDKMHQKWQKLIAQVCLINSITDINQKRWLYSSTNKPIFYTQTYVFNNFMYIFGH